MVRSAAAFRRLNNPGVAQVKVCSSSERLSCVTLALPPRLNFITSQRFLRSATPSPAVADRTHIGDKDATGLEYDAAASADAAAAERRLRARSDAAMRGPSYGGSSSCVLAAESWSSQGSSPEAGR